MRKASHSWIERIKRWVHNLYLRVLRIRATPEQIARGLALGIFVGCLPIIPMQTIIIIPLAILFRASKLAGFIASFISNPINLIPFYMLLWYIGSSIIPTPHSLTLDIRHLRMIEIFQQGFAVFTRMFLGGVVLGIPLSLLTYYITLPLLEKYKARRASMLFQKRKQHKDI